MLFEKALTFAASSSYVEEVDISLPKSTTCLSVLADSVNKHNASEFLSSKFLAHDTEIRGAVKAVSCHFSYRSNVSMKSLFLAMFSDNAIVKEHGMTKDKMRYYVIYEIASVFRDEMLLICVQGNFLQYAAGEKKKLVEEQEKVEKNKKEKKTFAITY